MRNSNVCIPGFLNRDFKATFTRGSLLGLSTAARSGDCTYTPALDDYIVKCGVMMPYARIAFDAIVKVRSLRSPSSARFEVDSNTSNS